MSCSDGPLVPLFSPVQPIASLWKGANMTDLYHLCLRAKERGASMVEYALLIVLIAVVALVAVNLIGPEVSNAYSSAGSGLAAN